MRIHATDTAQVLMPVMTTLHRRRCQVTALAYADDGSGNGFLEVTVRCPHRRSGSVPLWLGNIVGVLDVVELAVTRRTCSNLSRR
jgi:hypothetical protein